MDIKQAKEVMGSITRLYRAGKFGEEVLAILEVLEQTEKETQSRITALKAEESDLLAVKEKVLMAADEIKKAVSVKAGKIVAAAEAAAKKIALDADKIINAAKEAACEIQGDIANLGAQKTAAEKTLADLKAEIAVHSKDLADLNALKDKARKTLGI